MKCLPLSYKAQKNVWMMFLPPNVLIHPMYQGVIYKMKCMYMKEIIHRLLLSIDSIAGKNVLMPFKDKAVGVPLLHSQQ